MTTLVNGVGLGVGVGVGDGLGVGEGVGDGVGEGEGVGEGVGDGEGVGVEVGVGVGVALHEVIGVRLLRGAGALAAKSKELSSVSVQPSALRCGAEALPEAGALPEPSKQVAAEP